jgi:N6-adenosine-specific RNA methylase IME4
MKAEKNAALVIDAEFKRIIPPLLPEEREQLEKNLVAEGCRDALVYWDTDGRQLLVDGHNRYEICQQHGIAYQSVSLNGSEPWTRDTVKIWILTNQLGRRNLVPFQRTELALALADAFTAQAKERQRQSKGRGQKGPSILTDLNRGEARQALAKAARVSDGTFYKAKIIIAQAAESVKEGLRRGEVTIDAAYQKLTKESRHNLAVQKVAAFAPLSGTEGPFGVLVADPPWRYEQRAEDTTHRAANPYPSMTYEEICDYQLPGLADDAILWLWTTNAHLEQAFSVARVWTFTPKTVLTWVKDKLGLGDWLRGQTEHCLLCVRGKPVVTLTNQTTVLLAPATPHSQKPEAFFTLVESLCPDPRRGEVFARSARAGWVSIGAELIQEDDHAA